MNEQGTKKENGISEMTLHDYNHDEILLSELNYYGYKRKLEEITDKLKKLKKENPDYVIKFGDYQPTGICNMFGLSSAHIAATGRDKFLEYVDKLLNSKIN